MRNYKAYLSVILSLFVVGCCWMAKRDCFPPCPPKELVVVEKKCTLPESILADTIEIVGEGCPEGFVCFDVLNYGKLAKRLSDMKVWIRDAKARCGTFTISTDASLEVPDGGVEGATILNDASLD